jgi:opacity protein-like surface antigen
VNTWRLTTGVDYELSQNINTFFRYNYFDYNDQAMPYNAGQAHMLLGGLSGVF